MKSKLTKYEKLIILNTSWLKFCTGCNWWYLWFIKGQFQQPRGLQHSP